MNAVRLSSYSLRDKLLDFCWTIQSSTSPQDQCCCGRKISALMGAKTFCENNMISEGRGQWNVEIDQVQSGCIISKIKHISSCDSFSR